MTTAGGANDFVPDDDHVKFDCALFDAHNGESEGLDINFTEDVLKKIVNACNARIKDTGDYPPVTDGHTPDDENGKQPEILGFAKDFRIGEIGQTKPRPAIFATLCIRKDKAEQAKNLPRRSIELWRDGVIDPVVLKNKSPIDSVALLGATRPARDLGRMVTKHK